MTEKEYEHLGMKLIVSLNNEIENYMHCRKCVEEAMEKGVSPREYSDYEVGSTMKGVQVWCNRHHVNIAHIKLENFNPEQCTCEECGS